MRKTAIVLGLMIGLSGCETSSQAPDGSGASSSKPTAATTRRASGGENCELKNPTGTGPCDPRGSRAKSQSAPAKTERPFRPSDCTSSGLAGYARLAELGHRMTEWKAYCAAQEAAQAADAPSSRRSGASGGDADPGGTWYCDTVDGSGVYGRYGMRNLPEIDASTCKKVSD